MLNTFTRKAKSAAKIFRRKITPHPPSHQHVDRVLLPISDIHKEYLKWLIKLFYEANYSPVVRGGATNSKSFYFSSFEEYWDSFWRILSKGDLRETLHDYLDMVNLMSPLHQDRERIEDYYKSSEYIFLFRYLQYPLLFKNKLSKSLYPLLEAIRKSSSDEFSYCEVGPGVPHSLFYLAYFKPEIACNIKNIELFDLDMRYYNHVANALRKAYPNAKIVKNISNFYRTISPTCRFDYFRASDVFEHIFDPEIHMNSILSMAKERAFLEVDIGDRPAEKYQHITLELNFLREVIFGTGFVDIFEEVTKLQSHDPRMTYFARNAKNNSLP